MRVRTSATPATSLWFAAGFPPCQVSGWLGHMSVVTTDTIYSHLNSTDYSQRVARFEAFALTGAR